jgi:hypothetical protein
LIHFFTPTYPAFGTAAIIIRTPNEIIAAADSRSVNAYSVPDPTLFCKIKPFGKLYVVANGMVSDSLSVYNVFDILEKISNKNDSLSKKIDDFQKDAEISLQKALERLKRSDPIAFFRNNQDRASLGVNIFGIDQGVLVLEDMRFVVTSTYDDTLTIKVERHKCPGADCVDGIVCVPVGDTMSRANFECTANRLKNGNLAEIARTFVQKQIDTRDADVGTPLTFCVLPQAR